MFCLQLIQEPDPISVDLDNQIIYSLLHMLEQAGITEATFNINDPETYNLLYKAINTMQAGRDIGKLGFCRCDQPNLTVVAPNELVPAGQEIFRHGSNPVNTFASVTGFHHIAQTEIRQFGQLKSVMQVILKAKNTALAYIVLAIRNNT